MVFIESSDEAAPASPEFSDELSRLLTDECFVFRLQRRVNINRTPERSLAKVLHGRESIGPMNPGLIELQYKL